MEDEMDWNTPTADAYLPLDADQATVEAQWAWAEAAVQRMATQRHLTLYGTVRSVVRLAVYETADGDYAYRLPIDGDVEVAQRLRVQGITEQP